MRLLIDSHVVLLWMAGALPEHTDAAIAEADDVFASVVTLWELGIKESLGKLELPEPLAPALDQAGVTMLPVLAPHAVLAPRLPLLHRDPFDRMLVAQAQTERLTLCTADRRLFAYDVEILDAGPIPS